MSENSPKHNSWKKGMTYNKDKKKTIKDLHDRFDEIEKFQNDQAVSVGRHINYIYGSLNRIEEKLDKVLSRWGNSMVTIDNSPNKKRKFEEPESENESEDSTEESFDEDEIQDRRIKKKAKSKKISRGDAWLPSKEMEEFAKLRGAQIKM